MEIPTIPKVVLDNLLASMGSSAVMKEVAPRCKQNNTPGIEPRVPLSSATMQLPATLPMRTSAASLPPLPGRRESCASPPGTVFKDCLDSLATGGLVGLPSSSKGKPKRVRKSRAATAPKKRGISDLVLDANLEGAGQLPQGSPPKRRRQSVKSLENSENAEKPPPRKRNRSKAKTKDEHALASSTNDNSFSHSDTISSRGTLGVYGLDTKTVDLTQYMKDIPLEGLLAGDFNMPPFPWKQAPPASSMMDSSFGSHVSSILQNLTRPSSVDQSRPVSPFSKPLESRPPKFSFDLESTPLEESEDNHGGSLLDNKINAPGCEAPTTFIQGRKTQDASSRFSLETIPVIPPADFWNTLQIHSNVSLDSLISQASATSDSRFSPSDLGPRRDKSSTLPPSMFSLGSTQVPQESAWDRLTSSKLNHWFRAEPPKQDVLQVSASQENGFPFKLDVESSPPLKPTEKCGPKEGLLDIDLNKESPEAEAESVGHSMRKVVSQPEVGNESPVVAQARFDTDNTGGSLSEHKGMDIDVLVPVKVAEATCNIDAVIDGEVQGHVLNKGLNSQQDGEITGRFIEESSLVSAKKNHDFDQVKDASTHVLTSLPALLVLDAPETQEMCTDVPYSPGMQATARLLCRMAISSSPFYVEKDDKGDEHTQPTVSCNDTPELPAKAASVVGSVDKDGRGHARPTGHPNLDKEYTHKVHPKDANEKALCGQLVGNSTFLVDKANGSEPLASTPPRHAPQNVVSRVSGSQSSESDRSPCHVPREHTSNRSPVIPNKVQRDQNAGAASHSRVMSSFTGKDSKGTHVPVSKTSFLHALPTTKSSSVSTQKKSTACETKQSSVSHGEGFTKISRPRSNMSKNCLQAQRSTACFSVQPRNLNGCSIKSPSSRHVLPYVGEVRHGSK